MELILADKYRLDVRNLAYDVDFEIGEKNDFEMCVPISKWDKRIDYDCVIYTPLTEFGGIITSIESSTVAGEIRVGGYTWRGILEKKIIEPDPGMAYKIVSGELHGILNDLMVHHGLEDVFKVQGSSPIEIKGFQFDRYCNLLEGIQKMLRTVNCSIDFSYIKMNSDPGYVAIQANKIKNLSDRVEISQDGDLQFVVKDDRGGVNHLICLGQGELENRMVRHLYVSEFGEIGTKQYFKGVQERTEVYDNNNAANEQELLEGGEKELKKCMNSKTLKTSLKEEFDEDVQLEDIISGKDYITGIMVQKPIVGKIVTVKNGNTSIRYKIEGDD